MKRAITFIMLFLIGCRHEMPGIPRGVMHPEKLKMIMSDMLIADALSETRALGGNTEKQYTEQYYATIFRNHGITREDFVKSYQFYEDNPVLLNKLYDDILSEISKREAAISGEDSLKFIKGKQDSLKLMKKI